MFGKENKKLAIIGLGYLGLPLAAELGEKYTKVGFDINQARVSELRDVIDSTLECSADELQETLKLTYLDSTVDLKAHNVYFVTVPTPIYDHK
ncbi:hypothetical protein H4J56_03450 [Colwellia sp. BRX8-4]|uniref:hypothetical protein n=1 Tax=Colwellia sp. BRX8-4 TaxID=2759836 RepID=UPI0015F4ADA8|nr:hypothetical protein [Colwellia sp. BRX8-4]MBA6365203.1 hypothetical protein [Colwellia sp. BRX8-8]MBA6370479.1 hypothetical protein [Colwellia sp. BRX8-4]